MPTPYFAILTHFRFLSVSTLAGAALQAYYAASKVPSPEPQPRKEKRKKLSWAPERQLKTVRTFRWTEPAVNARTDADLTVMDGDFEGEGEEEGAVGFSSAMRNEHADERAVMAALLKNQDLEEIQRQEADWHLVRTVFLLALHRFLVC